MAKSDIKEEKTVERAAVTSTTESTPAAADETPMPNELNTEGERPPVATQKPDTPIAQTLAAGAGEHTPPDPGEFDPAGRPVTEESEEAAPQAKK